MKTGDRPPVASILVSDLMNVLDKIADAKFRKKEADEAYRLAQSDCAKILAELDLLEAEYDDLTNRYTDHQRACCMCHRRGVTVIGSQPTLAGPKKREATCPCGNKWTYWE